MEIICRESNQQLIRSCQHKIQYSDKYDDDHNEYRYSPPSLLQARGLWFQNQHLV